MNLNVKVRNIVEDGTPLKAVCSVTFDDMFCVHGVRVIKTSKEALIVVMPCRSFTDEAGNVTRKDIVHPTSNEARKALEEAVLTAYEVAKSISEIKEEDA